VRRSILLLVPLLIATLFVLASPAQQRPMAPPAIGSVTLPAHGPDTAPIYQAASTKKMADRLRVTFAATDWRLDPNKPGERVSYYTQLLSSRKLSLHDDTTVREQLAKEMLQTGDNESAVRQLEEVRRRWQAPDEKMPPEAVADLGQWLGIAYLRLGEMENCAHMHGQRACLFPLQRSAVHQLPRGAEGAVREFTALLEKNPSDYQSQWLLNVAYMQLGRYPKDVPPRWLVPESLFKSDYQLPEFPEVAAAAGVDITGHAGGVLVADFDGDGRLDIMVSSSGPLDQIHLFHNNGDGTFSDVTRASGLIGETGGLNLVLTDYNNDGRPDVLVLRGGWWRKQGCYPLSLLRNNGNGTFDDVTVEAGLLSAHPTGTAAVADFDNDGYLDIFVGHESTPDDPNPSQLFHNNRDGTFTDIAAASGISELGFVKGVAWGDFNNDGRPDLYVSTMYGHNHLFRNDGPRDAHDIAKGWRFTDVTESAGVGKQSNSFATWFFDYDNDGWPDIFVAGYSLDSASPNGEESEVGGFELGHPVHAELPKLYRNNHDGTFADVTAAVHLDRVILTMGANFGDLDNDGWLDLYLGTGDSTYQSLLPNRLFRNAEGHGFQDVTTAADLGHLQKGHGIAFADLRGTGFEDIFEEMGGAQPGDAYQSALYRNPGNQNHSITLSLEGVRSNRLAYGARIDVTVKPPHAPLRHIYRTVGYGSSFGGNPLRQHIGIGLADRVAEITVTWPTTGIVDRIHDIPADRSYKLREGAGRLTQLAVR
jgi:hypothetical protein